MKRKNSEARATERRENPQDHAQSRQNANESRPIQKRCMAAIMDRAAREVNHA